LILTNTNHILLPTYGYINEIIECINFYFDRCHYQTIQKYFPAIAENDDKHPYSNRYLVLSIPMKGHGREFYVSGIIESLKTFTTTHQNELFYDSEDSLKLEKWEMFWRFIRKLEWRNVLELVFDLCSNNGHQIILVLSYFDIEHTIDNEKNDHRRAKDQRTFLSFLNQWMKPNKKKIKKLNLKSCCISKSFLLYDKNVLWANSVLKKIYEPFYQWVNILRDSEKLSIWNQFCNSVPSKEHSAIEIPLYFSVIDALFEIEELVLFFPFQLFDPDIDLFKPKWITNSSNDRINDDTVFHPLFESIDSIWKTGLISGENTFESWTYLLWTEGILVETPEDDGTLVLVYNTEKKKQWFLDRIGSYKKDRLKTDTIYQPHTGIDERYLCTTFNKLSITEFGEIQETIPINQSFHRALSLAMYGELDHPDFKKYVHQWMMNAMCQRNDTKGANELSFKTMLIGFLSASPYHSILSEMRQIDVMMEICNQYRMDQLHPNLKDVIIELKRIPLNKIYQRKHKNTIRNEICSTHREIYKLDLSNDDLMDTLYYVPYTNTTIKSTNRPQKTRLPIKHLIEFAEKQVLDYWDDLHMWKRGELSLYRPVGFVIIAIGWSNLIVKRVNLTYIEC
jgi:hypothetical protein